MASFVLGQRDEVTGRIRRVLRALSGRPVETRTNPNRDSGFDASVITHELFHGVSNRLVTGGGSTGCLGGPQGGAMGEGWSDFFPCSFWDQPTVGGYLVNNYVRGIRRAAEARGHGGSHTCSCK